MSAKGGTVAVAVGALVLSIALAEAAAGEEVMEPRSVVAVVAGSESGRTRPSGESSDRQHEQLGTYPLWYRYHHRYGRDDRYVAPDPPRHDYHRVYPRRGSGFYISLPWGWVGYWRDGGHYGYVPYRHVREYSLIYRSVPDRYVGGDAYREYIILDTPTVPEQARALEAAPPGPAEAQAPPAGAAEFDSKLAPMLEGRPRVGAAFALGEARLKVGEFTEAVSAFRQALWEDPGAPAARLALALALGGEGDYAGAAQMLRLGLNAVRDVSVISLEPVEVFGSAEAFDEVVSRVRATAEQKPDADVLLVLGFLDFASGRFETAREALWAAYDASRRDPLVGRLLLAAERHVRMHPEGARRQGDEAQDDG